MGITIHYDIKIKCTKEKLKEKLDQAIELMIKAGAKPTRLIEFEFPRGCTDWNALGDTLAAKYPDAAQMADMRWYVIQQSPFGDKEMPVESVGFSVRIMKGCEPMNISLVNHAKGSNDWKAGSFCKTQYADDFEKAHLLVCSCLKIMESLGFTLDVSDEAGYYESGNLGKLQEEKGMMDAVIGSVNKMFQETLPPGTTIVTGDGRVIEAKKKKK